MCVGANICVCDGVVCVTRRGWMGSVSDGLLTCRYDTQLLKARKEGMKKGFFSSLVVGGLYLIIFSTFALGFW